MGNFRLKKARKALRCSGRRNRQQLITRRSLVQVQPPQPQNRLISQEIRQFFFTFCLKRFPEKLCDFAKFAIDPNRDPDGVLNCTQGSCWSSCRRFWSIRRSIGGAGGTDRFWRRPPKWWSIFVAARSTSGGPGPVSPKREKPIRRYESDYKKKSTQEMLKLFDDYVKHTIIASILLDFIDKMC